MPSQSYVVVGDLVASRRVPDRKGLGRQIDRTLRGLAKAYPGEGVWLAPPMTTRGIDEISGVMRGPRRGFDVAVALNVAIWPQRFRVALAAGTIDVGLDTGDASEMDGQAFHRAAAALQHARDHEIGFAVALPGQPTEVCRLVEALAGLHEAIVAGWTPRSAQVVVAYRRHGNQSAAARQLGVGRRRRYYSFNLSAGRGQNQRH